MKRVRLWPRILILIAGLPLSNILAQTFPATSLNLSRKGGEVELSWPHTPATPFYLQFASDLSELQAWNNAADPSLSGGIATCLDPITSTARFYRLSAWDVLFNGQVVNLIGDGLTYFPSGSWTSSGGEIRNVLNAPGITLVTRDAYTNFDLTLEWAASAGNANSGIFYFMNPGLPAAELQLVNNSGYPTYTTNQYCGGLYNLIAPTNAVLNALNQFNTVRLIVKNGAVEHWFNGVRVVAYQLDSPIVVKSLGNLTSGRIGLQFHGGTYRYRNIFIRRLPSQ